ncbi:MAG: branched chain amino acid aminotransferase, partial [Saprospiraceae bacterium]|nr:branched chain amino acid aminotransferase [Saprospiraceae bacterium]
EVEVRPVTIDEIVEAHEAGQLEEAFGSGTAAVVGHVAKIGYRGEDLVLPPVEDRIVSHFAKKQIDGLRAGIIKDTYGWIVPVGSNITAEVE